MMFVWEAGRLYNKVMLAKLEKKLIGLIIWIIAISCVVFFGIGDYLKLAGYAITIIFIILPDYLFDNWLRFQKTFSPEFLIRVQFVLALAGFLNLLGSLGFYTNPHTAYYDTFVHFINPVMIFTLTAVIPILLQKIIFKKTNLFITLFINALIIIFLSVAWEFYESFIDLIFKHSKMFGDNKSFLWDTGEDLIADIIGGAFACWLIYARFYGYIVRNVSYKIKL
ncbi:MAG: hypothetical protein WC669_03285 [Patescibacteria group bacterium]